HPIVSGPQHHAGGHLHGFMARAAGLEENEVLTLQGDLAIIQPAGGMHDPESAGQRLRFKTIESRRVLAVRAGWHGRHASPNSSVEEFGEVLPDRAPQSPAPPDIARRRSAVSGPARDRWQTLAPRPSPARWPRHSATTPSAPRSSATFPGAPDQLGRASP